MDVMEPKLVWIEGRCYRFYESDAWSAKDHIAAPYVEDTNPQEFSDLNEDTCPIDMDIVPIDGGRYKHSFYVPKLFFRFLIGTNGSVRKKLEQETKTSITIPKLGKDGDVVITSSSRTAIISARHRINLIVESSRKKLKATHFIAIPMRDETIASNFEKFKNTILNEIGKNSTGVHEDIFQKPEKMHLTLGMLLLTDDEEIKFAIDALNECCETIIKPIIKKHHPIKIKVQGLGYFNDDPTEVSVLFAKVSSENNVLQELSEKALEYFIRKELMRKEHSKLNLHLTLMNSSFAVDNEKSSFLDYKKFDITDIMKVYKDYYFGEIVLNAMHLCFRGAKAADGYYEITSKVDLVD